MSNLLQIKFIVLFIVPLAIVLFEQSFRLAEYTFVDKAEMKDGVLQVYLKQELPEDKKEKTIEIA